MIESHSAKRKTNLFCHPKNFCRKLRSFALKCRRIQKVIVSVNVSEAVAFTAVEIPDRSRPQTGWPSLIQGIAPLYTQLLRRTRIFTHVVPWRTERPR